MILKRLSLSIASSVIFLAGPAQGYIPGNHFVFDRVTAQHGKGHYIIDDEVTLREGTETFVIKENWLVVDGGEMRVIAAGPATHVYKIIKRGRGFWLDQSGSER